METIRKWIRNTFGFSGRETNGFIILLPLMVIIVLTQPAYRWWISNRSEDFSQERKHLDSLILVLPQTAGMSENTKKQASLFFFNPNKASVADLQKLGFAENLSTRIASYRQKGGVFRVKSDLLKIYGIDSTLYHQLYPYIQLPERNEKEDSGVKPQISQHKAILPSFDLNVADTAQLMSVYGIGPALAARIIKFRNALGGFIKPEQLTEVYGLDTTVVHRLFQKSFIHENFLPRKININTADEKELSAHPYIRKPLAKAMVAYRFQHGDYREVNDFRKLTLIKPADADRLIPYLRTSD